MKIYNYQSIDILYAAGNVGNGLEKLQETLRNGLSIHTDRSVHPKEIERLKRLKNKENQSHNEPHALRRSNNYKKGGKGDGRYDNSAIIFSSGVGFGTKDYEYFDKHLKEINELLARNNTHIFFIRGNNDDPSYFAEHKLDYSNIKLLEDYSVVKFSNFNCLCIGGGISFDRKWKQTQEERYGKKLYWENEAPVKNDAELQEILSENDIACVVTNTPPSFAGKSPMSYHKSKWSETDKEIVDDAINARLVIDDIYREFVKASKRPYMWVYNGDANVNSIADIRFLGTSNNSFFNINSAVEDYFGVRIGLPRQTTTLKSFLPHLDGCSLLNSAIGGTEELTAVRDLEHEDYLLFDDDEGGDYETYYADYGEQDAPNQNINPFDVEPRY